MPLIGSVQDRDFIANAMANHQIDTIYHAAAYKHVPLMEKNIEQAVKNNSLGTLVVAEEAVRANVASFTLISTDKAVNPHQCDGGIKAAGRTHMPDDQPQSDKDALRHGKIWQCARVIRVGGTMPYSKNKSQRAAQ